MLLLKEQNSLCSGSKGIMMNTDLYDLYQDIEDKFGKMPLVVFPAEIDEAIGKESYWVVFEYHDRDASSREIVWLIGGEKDISEAEGPAASSCPLYFFELVPNVESPEWRERVKWFWLVEKLPKSAQDSAWEAYDAGIDAYRSLQKKNRNPHDLGSFNHIAWETGWDHAKVIG